MKRIAVALTLASLCLVACSRENTASRTANEPQPPPASAASAEPQQTPPPSSEPVKPEPAGKPEATATAGSAPAPAAAPKSAAAGANPPAERPSSTTARPTETAPPAAAPPAEPLPEPAAPKPAPPPEPEFREVTIPAGTSIAVTLLNALASNASKPEDRVGGSVAKPIVVSGLTALPAGAQLNGAVTEVHASGRVKGKASVAFRFQQLVVRGESYSIETAQVKQEAGSGVKSDVKKGGVGAGVGAIVGGVVGGGKGAAIGAVAGGTGAVLATKGQEVELPAGTEIAVLLQQPLTVTVPLKKQ